MRTDGQAASPLRYRLARLLGHQHWIPRGRSRLVRTIVDPDRIGPTPFTTTFFGKTYHGDLSYLLDWHVYMFGGYAMHELYLLRDACQALRRSEPSIAFYDVGANVGQHSLFMSAYADRVISFEPYDKVRKALTRKLSDNDIRNVSVFPFGIGAQNETLRFHTPTTNNVGKGTFHDTDEGDTLVLEVRKGDNVISDNSLPKIGILKVDVEGFESQVFAGLKQSILRDRPLILTEISREERSGFGTKAEFENSFYDGARCFDVLPAGLDGGYKLRPTRFGETSEVLVVPIEMIALLSPSLKLPA